MAKSQLKIFHKLQARAVDLGLLHSSKQGAKSYQIRSAGNSIRLYTNGVFHSQFNPRQLGGGCLWDILAAPTHFVIQKPARALFLGVGGGAAIRFAKMRQEFSVIDAVDLDSVHLRLAKKYFSISGKGISLYENDAIKWIDQPKNPPYDYILDDLFGEQVDSEGLPVRAVKPTQGWLDILVKNLSDVGVLVINVESRKEATKLIKLIKTEKIVRSAVLITSMQYDNVVVVLSKRVLEEQDLAGFKSVFKFSALRQMQFRLYLFG